MKRDAQSGGQGRQTVVIIKEKLVMKGKVVAVNISENKGEQKHSIEQGVFKQDHGLVGDAHAGKGLRQVSLLGQESIDKMNQNMVKGLCSGNFAENITTRGLVLYEIRVGTRIRIGQTVQEVTQIGKKCHDSGCAVMREVGSCIMPSEGIFTKVVQGGVVKPGDDIEVAE